MTCAIERPTFRLLDPMSGWEQLTAERVVQRSDAVTLALRSLGLGSATGFEIERCVLPRWVAVDGRGAVYLLGDDGVVRRRGPCETDFAIVGALGGTGGSSLCHSCLDPVTAVTATGALLAVATKSGHVLVFDDGGRRLLSRFPLRRPGERTSPGCYGTALAFEGEELLVAITDARANRVEVRSLTVVGTLLNRWRLSTADEIIALGLLPIGSKGFSFAAVTARGDSWREVWPLSRKECPRPDCGCGSLEMDVCGTADSLRPCDDGLCLPPCVAVRGSFTGLGGQGEEQWFSRDGNPTTTPLAREERWERDGWLETEPLDGGHDDARWSRVRTEADVPIGCSVRVEVAVLATMEESVPDHAWQLVSGHDGLIPGQPQGRYAKVRVALGGDGTATPAVRSIRLDVDVTSLLHDLPAVFSEDPVAAEFTDRFLAMLNVGVEDLGSAISGISSLFSAVGVRDELLGFVGGALGEDIDPTWEVDRLRTYLSARPGLEQLRGTSEGLRAAVLVAYGIDVDVTEHGVDRPWGRVNVASIGSVRLAAASRAAVRLDATPLGTAPLDQSFDPLLGALASGAHRVTVNVPFTAAVEDPNSAVRVGLERLIRAWCPAHLLVGVRFSSGRVGFGPTLRLGIDTTLRGLPAAVLRGTGDSACRLQRSSVVARGTRFANRPIVLGVRSNAGLNTTLG